MKTIDHYLVTLWKGIKNSSIGYFMVMLLIFAAGLTISILYWQGAEDHLNATANSQYQRELEQSESIVTQRLQQYTNLLSAGSGLLAVDGANLTQTDWLTFFQSYNLSQNYPGIAAVSFSQNVVASDLGNYLSNVSAQVSPNFSIVPAGNRAVYAPVTYIAYISPISLQALGYDELSNPIRAAAIDRARDTGKITISGKISSLVAADKGQSAFIMYLPVYQGLTSTIQERRSSIYGYVFAAINAHSFFSSLLEQYLSSGVAIQIYDGTTKTASTLLYQTAGYTASVRHSSSETTLLPFSFGGHTWTIKVVTARSLLQAKNGAATISKLYLGIAASAVLTAIVWYFTTYRERKITWQKQLELQAAKDDLLSLASHQLRTPATIVKQYLGVMLQGYAGDLTKRQREIVNTAYESNERQLEIANQFLSAARLGSGQITLRKKPIDINKMLEQVIKDQQKIIDKRTQKIIYKPPQRANIIKADPHYLPMVFENLLGNAVKYSKGHSKITVSVRKSKGNLLVTVADDGIGIPQAELATLFDKFTRLQNNLTADANGSGIGLYLVKQIVTLHKGDISVQSTPTKGSTFIVCLPLSNST